MNHGNRGVTYSLVFIIPHYYGISRTCTAYEAWINVAPGGPIGSESIRV